MTKNRRAHHVRATLELTEPWKPLWDIDLIHVHRKSYQLFLKAPYGMKACCHGGALREKTQKLLFGKVVHPETS